MRRVCQEKSKQMQSGSGTRSRQRERCETICTRQKFVEHHMERTSAVSFPTMVRSLAALVENALSPRTRDWPPATRTDVDCESNLGRNCQRLRLCDYLIPIDSSPRLTARATINVDSSRLVVTAQPA